MSPRLRAGVTVIEVFIALLLIAFVSAVLFPVFQKVKETTNRRGCPSNMMQLGVALIQYTQDADGLYPAGATTAGTGWAEEIYPFVKVSDVYHCRDAGEDGKFISYAENQNMVKQNSVNLPAPNRTIALYEFTTLGCDPAASETNSATGLSAPQDSERHDSPNFPHGLNFLAVDGHVKFLTPEKVSGGPNAVRARALPQGAVVETFAIK